MWCNTSTFQLTIVLVGRSLWMSGNSCQRNGNKVTQQFPTANFPSLSTFITRKPTIYVLPKSCSTYANNEGASIGKSSCKDRSCSPTKSEPFTFLQLNPKGFHGTRIGKSWRISRSTLISCCFILYPKRPLRLDAQGAIRARWKWNSVWDEGIFPFVQCYCRQSFRLQTAMTIKQI